MSSPSSGYNSSGTGSGSQEDEGRAEDEEEEERLLIDLSSPLGEKTSISLLGPPPHSGPPQLVKSRRSWTTFDDDDFDQNNAFSR